MTSEFVPSDIGILDLLRKQEAMSVSQLATAMGVTATAVRQRLARLMPQGYVEREAVKAEQRGRPSHRYRLTAAGRRKNGSNFADLAFALWEEIRAIADPEVRRGLLQRLSKRMAALYSDQLPGADVAERMESLAALFRQRQIPFEVERRDLLPVLQAHACPYPELAEKDRSICAMERLMFSELLGEAVHLTNCRLDGGSCCTFELN